MRREGYEVVSDWGEITYSYSWNCCERLLFLLREGDEGEGYCKREGSGS